MERVRGGKSNSIKWAHRNSKERKGKEIRENEETLRLFSFHNHLCPYTSPSLPHCCLRRTALEDAPPSMSSPIAIVSGLGMM